MARYIDADALIDMLLTENQRCITSTNHELSVNMVVSFIKNQPTAYNVEAVLAELEEKQIEINGNTSLHYLYSEGYSDAIDYLIEIVRKGGVHE